MTMAARKTPRSLTTVRDPARASELVNPRRGHLLSHLAEPESAAGLARKLGLPRQRVGYHLRQLERAGLIECVGKRRKRNCVERLMRVTARAFVISPDALVPMADSQESARDWFSAATQVQAAARVIQEVAALEARASAEGRRLATLTIDTAIRFAGPTERAAFTEELTETVARIVAKCHDDSAPGGRTFRLVLCAHPTRANAAPDTGVAFSTPHSVRPHTSTDP